MNPAQELISILRAWNESEIDWDDYDPWVDIHALHRSLRLLIELKKRISANQQTLDPDNLLDEDLDLTRKTLLDLATNSSANDLQYVIRFLTSLAWGINERQIPTPESSFNELEGILNEFTQALKNYREELPRELYEYCFQIIHHVESELALHKDGRWCSLQECIDRLIAASSHVAAQFPEESQKPNIFRNICHYLTGFTAFSHNALGSAESAMKMLEQGSN